MIRATLCTEAPGDSGVPARVIDGSLAFGTVAAAAAAHRFTAAIVVCNQIILVLRRIVAGTNPVDSRGLTARRAAFLATAATGA